MTSVGPRGTPGKPPMDGPGESVTLDGHSAGPHPADDGDATASVPGSEADVEPGLSSDLAVALDPDLDAGLEADGVPADPVDLNYPSANPDAVDDPVQGSVEDWVQKSVEDPVQASVEEPVQDSVHIPSERRLPSWPGPGEDVAAGPAGPAKEKVASALAALREVADRRPEWLLVGAAFAGLIAARTLHSTRD